MHRVFLAINLPENIKKSLVDCQERITASFPEVCPIRWTNKENLHITLVFLGAISNDELLEVCKIVKEVAEKTASFSVNLNRICYGPPKTMPPRMVWVDGEKSPEFTALKDSLEKSLISGEAIHFSPENRAFSPHITLGRIKTWAFRQIEPEERPTVDKEISLVFPVESIEVMESELKRRGAEYAILETCLLGSQDK